MTVGELIDILAHHPDSTPVFIGNGLGGADDVQEVYADSIFSDGGNFVAIIID